MTFNDLLSDNGLFCDGDWIEKKDQDVNGLVRLIQLADIGICEFKDKSNKYITEQTAQNLNCTYLKKGDILIARLPEPLGRACIFPYDGKFITAVDVAILRPANDKVNNQYIMYLINSPQFRKQIKKFESGTTRKRISRKNLDRIDFKIPDYQDQHRIVTRIEELFSQLDSGVETLKKTKEQLKVYRQAALKEAFDECDSRVDVDSVCCHITDGDHMPPPKSPEGIPFIMISNIYGNKINWENTAFVNEDYYNNIDYKRKPQKGDVLYTVTGSFGIPVLVEFDKQFCFQRHIALLRPSEKIDQKFLYYVMQAPEVYSQASKRSTGTAQKTVGLGVLRKILIPYTDSIEIQNRIVTEIESRLSVCDSIEKTIDTALQEAEALRQSILKQAFEGGL